MINPAAIVSCPHCKTCLDDQPLSPARMAVQCPDCRRWIVISQATADRLADQRLRQTKLFPPEQRRLFDDR